MLSKRTIFLATIAVLVAILVANMCFNKCCETFRGGRRGRGGGRGRRGGLGRHWAGPRRYGYGPRFRRNYYYWPFYSVPLTYGCKSGCVNLGNGEWGCQFPGDGITQCQFSADCEACDDQLWWRPTTWFY